MAYPICRTSSVHIILFSVCVCVFSGQLKLALKAAQNAMDILVVFKGPDSPECLEVNAMLKFLSSST